jgi:hypothetical protein
MSDSDFRVGIFRCEQSLRPDESETCPATIAMGHFPYIVILGAEFRMGCRADGQEESEDKVRKHSRGQRHRPRIGRLCKLQTASYDRYSIPGNGGNSASTMNTSNVEDSCTMAAYSERE